MGPSVAAQLARNLIMGYPWRVSVVNGRRGTERRKAQNDTGDEVTRLFVWGFGLGTHCVFNGIFNFVEINPHGLKIYRTAPPWIEPQHELS